MRNVLNGFTSIGGVYPSSSLPEIQSRRISTEDALREDWQRVGADIKISMNRFENERKSEYSEA